jgi:hypothetical protein
MGGSKLVYAQLESCGRAFWGLGLWMLACWDCGFDFRQRGGCLSCVSVVCCQAEVSATGRSLAQRSPTESARVCMCVYLCVRVSLSAIRCSNNRHLQWVGKRGIKFKRSMTKKERIVVDMEWNTNVAVAEMDWHKSWKSSVKLQIYSSMTLSNCHLTFYSILNAVINIATKLQVKFFKVRIPVGERFIYFLQKHLDWPLGPLSLQWLQAFLLLGKISWS